MRCVFCKLPSHDTKSVEHIVPESMGNKRRVLRRGLVCDSCNNYFARKVEAPLLAHSSFRNLRARWQVPTKRGAKPFWQGVVAGTDIEVGLRLDDQGAPELVPERRADQAKLAAMLEHGSPLQHPLVFREDMDPPKTAMSRFLAKVAIEALADRCSYGPPERLSFLIDAPFYDRMRNWARRGQGAPDGWPYSQRRIAPEETYMLHPETGEWVRAGFSYDLFMTKRRETFFAFCLYGHEWVINVGGPSIKGYEEWLADHDNISPLVERLGGTLQMRSGDQGLAYYWDGDSNLDNGVEFDRVLMDGAASDKG